MAYLSPAFFIFRIGPRSGVGTGEAAEQDMLAPSIHLRFHGISRLSPALVLDLVERHQVGDRHAVV